MKILSETNAIMKGFTVPILEDDNVVGLINTVTYKDFLENHIPFCIFREDRSDKFVLARKDDYIKLGNQL